MSWILTVTDCEVSHPSLQKTHRAQWWRQAAATATWALRSTTGAWCQRSASKDRLRSSSNASTNWQAAWVYQAMVSPQALYLNVYVRVDIIIPTAIMLVFTFLQYAPICLVAPYLPDCTVDFWILLSIFYTTRKNWLMKEIENTFSLIFPYFEVKSKEP